MYNLYECVIIVYDDGNAGTACYQLKEIYYSQYIHEHNCAHSTVSFAEMCSLE